MSKAYFLQTVPDVVDQSRSLLDKLKLTVNNTGNYFFEYAVKKQLADYECVLRASDIPVGCECLILSMSNFLSPYTDLGRFTQTLEEKRVKKIVMIGAGAQANDYNESISLTDGTKRFLHFIAERSESIGVRGNYTKKIMEDYGVTNAEVIGCPSIFLHRNRDFSVKSLNLPENPKVAFHYTPTGHYRDSLAYLNTMALEFGSAYIAQSELDLVKMYDDDEVQYMFSYYNDGKYSPDQLKSWFLLNTKWFFDMDTWMSFMSTLDFSVGSRFHGNMAAIQSGVPALNLVFDTRTRELCEYLNLPTMQLDEINSDTTLENLYERADYSLFNATYATKYNAYINFLNRNGVAHFMGDSSFGSSGPRVPLANVGDLLVSLRDREVDERVLLDAIRQRLRESRSSEDRKSVESGNFPKFVS